MDLTKVGGNTWQKSKSVPGMQNTQFYFKPDHVADFLQDAKAHKNSNAMNDVLAIKRSKKARQFVS
jgi:hypothetical protein